MRRLGQSQDVGKYAEHERWLEESGIRKRNRAAFLRVTNAQPTPVAFYAAWLCAWLKSGGTVTHPRDYDYASIGTVMAGDSVISDPNAAPPFTPKVPPTDPYKHLGISKWTPTSSTNTPIPTGYGSMALELLIVPQLVTIPTQHTSTDIRDGWEWGHSTVLTLIRQGTTIIATTNHPDVVASYPDVDRWIAQQGGRAAVIRQAVMSLQRSSLAQKDHKALRQAIASH